MDAVNGGNEGPPPPSPLTGCYLLIVIGEPHSQDHKDIILQRVAKGLLSWDLNNCLVDLEKELAIITEQAPEGEEARYGERLIQFASENLVTEVLIHPSISTLAQCIRNLLSSFTRHRHIIHAGYTFAANGSWALQDGTFSYADFSEAFQEIEVQRIIRAYENNISVDIHCSTEGDWSRLPKEPFTKSCKMSVNPVDVLTSGSPSINGFLDYLAPFLIPTDIESLLESSDVVGNIRFSHPTLYVFPGGQGDAALFGINGFNMLLDGGFSRKACFWDFVRHLDRLDAVLYTRLNNSNVSGINAVLTRKKQNAVYPQIGHFFCNIQDRKALLSPDGDKDKDPLLINLLEEGQQIVNNLGALNLSPQPCYRDTEPINLYHKVGHGTLDMYVLSPTKDSKEVKEFLQKWNNNDQKLFSNTKVGKDFQFPIQNLVSICALLVWQPANPRDTITRILFPGSTPQHKIFEGLDKLKQLEFIKYPVCTEKNLTTSSSIIGLKSKGKDLEKLIQNESKVQKIDSKPKEKKILDKPKENKLESMKNGNGIDENGQEKTVKKSDSTESDKSVTNKVTTKTKKIDVPKEAIGKEEKKIKDTKFKPKKVDPISNRSVDRKAKVDKKSSPTTPKKTVEHKATIGDKPKTGVKSPPIITPAKSAKEATNRRVVESKKLAPKKETKPLTDKKPAQEKKTISKKSKTSSPSRQTGSPIKKVNGVQRPEIKKGRLDKEGTTDSSTVSTPTADPEFLKKDLSKLTPEEIEQLKAQELADLKEEQEVVKEIEAVFRKGEQQDVSESDLRKVQDLSIDDKTEPEEYLIIEKEEIEHDSLDEKEIKEDETQKHARDSEESEKQQKFIESEKKELEQVKEVESNQEKPMDAKEISVTSLEEKVDVSSDKKIEEELKESVEPNNALESQPDEKISATIESGATTAPTLPEDERITLDEIKETNGDQVIEENGEQVIEEKHVKEDTKENVPVIQLPPKTFEAVPKIPPIVGIRLDKQTHIRDIVKTPDEVADLPVHEEVDVDHYDSFHQYKDQDAKQKIDTKEPSPEDIKGEITVTINKADDDSTKLKDQKLKSEEVEEKDKVKEMSKEDKENINDDKELNTHEVVEKQDEDNEKQQQNKTPEIKDVTDKDLHQPEIAVELKESIIEKKDEENEKCINQVSTEEKEKIPIEGNDDSKKTEIVQQEKLEKETLKIENKEDKVTEQEQADSTLESKEKSIEEKHEKSDIQLKEQLEEKKQEEIKDIDSKSEDNQITPVSKKEENDKKEDNNEMQVSVEEHADHEKDKDNSDIIKSKPESKQITPVSKKDEDDEKELKDNNEMQVSVEKHADHEKDKDHSDIIESKPESNQITPVGKKEDKDDRKELKDNDEMQACHEEHADHKKDLKYEEKLTIDEKQDIVKIKDDKLPEIVDIQLDKKQDKNVLNDNDQKEELNENNLTDNDQKEKLKEDLKIKVDVEQDNKELNEEIVLTISAKQDKEQKKELKDDTKLPTTEKQFDSETQLDKDHQEELKDDIIIKEKEEIKKDIQLKIDGSQIKEYDEELKKDEKVSEKQPEEFKDENKSNVSEDGTQIKECDENKSNVSEEVEEKIICEKEANKHEVHQKENTLLSKKSEAKEETEDEEVIKKPENLDDKVVDVKKSDAKQTIKENIILDSKGIENKEERDIGTVLSKDNEVIMGDDIEDVNLKVSEKQEKYVDDVEVKDKKSDKIDEHEIQSKDIEKKTTFDSKQDVIKQHEDKFELKKQDENKDLENKTEKDEKLTQKYIDDKYTESDNTVKSHFTEESDNITTLQKSENNIVEKEVDKSISKAEEIIEKVQSEIKEEPEEEQNKFAFAVDTKIKETPSTKLAADTKICEKQEITSISVLDKEFDEVKDINNEEVLKNYVLKEDLKDSKLDKQFKSVDDESTVLEKKIEYVSKPFDSLAQNQQEPSVVMPEIKPIIKTELVDEEKDDEEIDHLEAELRERIYELRDDFNEKAELGRKSPKEREQDVAKIVASVAVVLKSDAPLEEFEGKIPFSPFSTFSCTHELRETHITTLDSPIVDESKSIVESAKIKETKIDEKLEETIKEEDDNKYDIKDEKLITHSFLEEEKKVSTDAEQKRDKISDLLRESQEFMQATSKMISDIKSSKTSDDASKETDVDKIEEDKGIVHKMLVTASSEDGGEETVICSEGSITFAKSSESSGRSSPADMMQKTEKEISTIKTSTEIKDLSKQIIDEYITEISNEIQEIKSIKFESANESTQQEIKKDDEQIVKLIEKGTSNEIKEVKQENVTMPTSDSSCDTSSKEDIKTIKDDLHFDEHIASDKIKEETCVIKTTKDDIQEVVKKSDDKHETVDYDKDLKKESGDMLKTNSKEEPQKEEIIKDDHVSISPIPALEKEIKSSPLSSGKITPEPFQSKVTEKTDFEDSKSSPLSHFESEVLEKSKIEELKTSALTETLQSEIQEKSNLEEVKSSPLSSGKISPEPLNSEIPEKSSSPLSSGKITPEPLQHELSEESNLESAKLPSGKISPEPKVQEKSNLEELKSSPVQTEVQEISNLELSPLSSGKITPEPVKSEILEKCDLSSGKITPEQLKSQILEKSDLKSSPLSSGKITPEPIQPEVQEISNLKAVKSSPIASGKISPELVHTEADKKLSSGKITPEPIPPEVQEISNLEAVKSSPISSGKITPELVHTEVDEKLSSGKITPEPIQPEVQEISNLEAVKSSPISSGKITPELVHTEVDEKLSSGKITPEPVKSEILEKCDLISLPLSSDKITPEQLKSQILEKSDLKSSPLSSGKITPEPIKPEVQEISNLEASPLSSGKITPEHTEVHKKSSSDKITPEPIKSEIMEKSDLKSSPLSSSKITPEPIKPKVQEISNLEAPLLSSSKITPEHTEVHKKSSSDKITPEPIKSEVMEKSDLKSSPLSSDKITPETIKPEVQEISNLEASGKITPEYTEVHKKSSSDKITPEPIKSEIMEKSDLQSSPLSSGKITPEPKQLNELEKCNLEELKSPLSSDGPVQFEKSEKLSLDTVIEKSSFDKIAEGTIQEKHTTEEVEEKESVALEQSIILIKENSGVESHINSQDDTMLKANGVIHIAKSSPTHSCLEHDDYSDNEEICYKTSSSPIEEPELKDIFANAISNRNDSRETSPDLHDSRKYSKTTVQITDLKEDAFNYDTHSSPIDEAKNDYSHVFMDKSDAESIPSRKSTPEPSDQTHLELDGSTGTEKEEEKACAKDKDISRTTNIEHFSMEGSIYINTEIDSEHVERLDEAFDSGLSTPDGNEKVCEQRLQTLKTSYDAVKTSSEKLNILKDVSSDVSGRSTPEEDYEQNIEQDVLCDLNVPSQINKTKTEMEQKSNEQAGPSIKESAASPTPKGGFSGKSTPDISDVERLQESQDIKHIARSSTPPTVPVSPVVKDISNVESTKQIKSDETTKDVLLLKMETVKTPEHHESDNEDTHGSPTSMASQLAQSPCLYEVDEFKCKMDQMNSSIYGALPDEPEEQEEDEQELEESLNNIEPSLLHELTKAKYSTGAILSKSNDMEEEENNISRPSKTQDLMTCSFIGTELPQSSNSSDVDPIAAWGKPLGLPSPAPPNDNKGTPKKEKKLPPNVTAKNKLNDDRKRSESPSKKKKFTPVYVDLTYVPHHGNSNYSYVDFFKRIRARYYVFSGIEPSKEVYNALLEAKQTWEDKDLEVTIIPTYDTDVLGYWVAENEDLLAKYKIDLSPSASRCTINLQDHETSCSAYRLEF